MKTLITILSLLSSISLFSQSKSQNQCLFSNLTCLSNGTYELEQNECDWEFQNKTPEFIKSFILFGNNENTLEFTLKALKNDHDIDFVIFKKTKSDILPLRTMLTGLERGGNYNEECVGPMGLRENFSQELTNIGCQDNNFLNPLPLLKNEEYLLVVFSKDASGTFKISKSTYRPPSIIDTYVKQDNEILASSELIHNVLNELSINENIEYPIFISKTPKTKYSFESKRCGSIVLKDNHQSQMIELKVIPNPTNEIADIQFNYTSHKNIRLEVLNELGVIVKKETIYANGSFYSHQLNVSNFISGNYIIRLSDGDNLIGNSYLIKI